MTYPKVSTTGEHTGTAFGVPASPRFPQIEDAVLARWAADDTFAASVANRPTGEDGANEFVFYDGPPFANGLPHYGHLLTGYVKDIVPRYETMRGRHVERRFGWDTHGLPAELEAMSQLGIKTKEEILELGIETFNAKCRESVMKYTGEWREYVTRQARWVDFDNDYKTLNPTFMESVLWAFKTLYDKGLVYEGFRCLPYCWNDQTPLSNHELRMDEEVYKNRQDPAVTVGYRLETGELALIWTTTPWTLPSNLAMAVRPDIDYVVVESDFTGRTGALPARRGTPGRLRPRARRRRRRAGRRAAQGQRPRRALPTPRRSPTTSATRSRTSCSPPTTSPPTTAPASCTSRPPSVRRTSSSPTSTASRRSCPSVPDGRFTFPVADYEGLHVFDANAMVIEHLKAATAGHGDHGSVTAGTVLLRRETYDHSYPHCWRCREPLIYMAVSSWFVEVTKFKDRMVELNQEITWVPEHVKDGQFGKWLENARDWSISRNRFWGSPIPVWRSRRPRVPADRRLRLVRGARARLRPDADRTRPASPTCTARSSTT